jgi:hypothetical protein
MLRLKKSILKISLKESASTMSNFEHLRISDTPKSIDDDRRELRRMAKLDADANEKYLRDLLGDDEYEDWDND